MSLFPDIRQRHTAGSQIPQQRSHSPPQRPALGIGQRPRAPGQLPGAPHALKRLITYQAPDSRERIPVITAVQSTPITAPGQPATRERLIG